MYAKSDIVITLVGNKSDLNMKRQISREQGEAFAKEHGFLFVETSAKSAVGVDSTFLGTAERVWSQRQARARQNSTGEFHPPKSGNVNLKARKAGADNKGCC
jgi:GTPase SAR1 family protein